ncbi:MAG TPA: nucleotide disphospho-sugar-binding domain-containing protein [Actinomycetes bacterium]|jgi:UDP:flavonoid glycosyltransferase YjiC (YdhE family)|nr:nucleotide disphospho-sugar-binding domain-containing protein [Actinomycetes bacterium]
MPFDGHFNPLTGIAMHLKQGGHDVRWYAGPSYQDKLDDLGIPGHVFQRAREVNGESIAALFPERAKLKGPKLISFDAEQIFVAGVEHHYRDILEVHARFPFDALFCDAAFYAAKLVTEKLQTPVYAAGVGPLLATSRDVPPPFFGLKPARTTAGRLVHRGARALLHSGLKYGVRRYNAVLTAPGLQSVQVDEWFDIPHQCARRYFQSGAPGLDYPRSDLPANVTFVGPLLPHNKTIAAAFAHQERLDSHKSAVVVVSQGTVDNHDPQKLIVPTLEALKDGPHLVVATTGGRHTEELRRRYPHDNLIIEDFVDFDALFAHTDVLICNGGYGSVMLALRHGVPILAAGRREMKNDINARLDYHGFGIDLHTERPTPKKLARGLTRILNDRTDGPLRHNLAPIRAELESYRPFEIIDRCLAEDAVPSTTASSTVGRAGIAAATDA